MLTPHEFAVAWGEDRYCFPPDILQGVDIPDATKTFLLEAGLPLRARGLGSHIVPLPLVPASPPVQAAKYPLLSRYRSTKFRLLAYGHKHKALYMGAEYDLYYAIEEGTGHIYWVGPGLEIEPEEFVSTNIFVNASVAQLAESLLCYREFVTRFTPVEPERPQIEPPFRSLKQKWQEIDAVALTDPDNYWVMYYLGLSLAL